LKFLCLGPWNAFQFTLAPFNKFSLPFSAMCSVLFCNTDFHAAMQLFIFLHVSLMLMKN
jgi:hypothetical protein